MLRTDFEFTLPCGYVDHGGTLHRDGVMRLSTARDELEATRDTQGPGRETYLSLVLLSRVITRLGSLTTLTPEMLEGLFSADFVYLQNLFVQLNDGGAAPLETQCPSCRHRFAVSLMDAVEA
jgi:hypothetical protein